MIFFVTGAAGCVGLAVVERLLELGADVLGVDLIDLPASAKPAFASLPGHLDFCRMDLRDQRIADRLNGETREIRIIHCAVQTPTATAERNEPRAIVTGNIDTTAAVLDLARGCRATHVVHVSSGGVYGSLEGRSDLVNGLVNEDHTLPQPRNLYAISKYAGEQVVTRYRELFDLPVLIARVALTFGPWERITGARGLVSAPHQILAHAKAGRPVCLERDSTRGWTSSRDIAAALVALSMRAGTEPGPCNIATPHRWALSTLLDHVARRYPSLEWQVAGPQDIPNTVLHFDFDGPNLDITRLTNMIGPDLLMTQEQAIETWLDWADTCWSPEFEPLA